MIPRRILAILVYALPLLIVCCVVVLGAATLAHATGDEGGAQVLRWVSLSFLMLTIVDLVLLVGVLGLKALAEEPEPLDPLDRE